MAWPSEVVVRKSGAVRWMKLTTTPRRANSTKWRSSHGEVLVSRLKYLKSSSWLRLNILQVSGCPYLSAKLAAEHTSHLMLLTHSLYVNTTSPAHLAQILNWTPRHLWFISVSGKGFVSSKKALRMNCSANATIWNKDLLSILRS